MSGWLGGGSGAEGACFGEVDELLLDVVDAAGDAGGVEQVVFGGEPGTGRGVGRAGVEEPLVGGCGFVVDTLLAAAAGLGPVDWSDWLSTDS